MAEVPEASNLKAIVLPLLALAGAGALNSFADKIAPITSPPIRQSGLEAHEESASASLLGQFRTNMSAWLWVHTDLYLHNGVHMRPLTDGERQSGIQVEAPKEDGHEEIHKEVSVTLVPSPDRDFRGLIGQVDREVSAWKPMKDHDHNDPMQTLPLFRLMTWLDPHFVEGWTTGATVIARDRTKSGTAKALEFLGQGRQENPDSVDVLTATAYLHITRNQNLEAAIPLLEKARKLGYEHRETLAEAERDALDNTYRWLCLCYRDTGRPGEVAGVAREGLRVFGDDPVLQRMTTLR